MNMFTRLTNNLMLKLFSLGLALLLGWYVYVGQNPEVVQNLDLPIKVVNLSEDLIIVDPDPLPTKMWIKAAGKLRAINQLSQSNHTVRLDCAQVTEPQSKAVRIVIPDFSSLGVEVRDQELFLINVEFREKATIEKLIKVNHRGEIDQNFEITSEKLSQDNVLISGPEDIINLVDEARVEPDISVLKENSTLRQSIILYDANGQVILPGNTVKIDPKQIDIELKVIPIGSIITLKVLPTFVGQPPDEYITGETILKPHIIPVDAELVPEDVFTIRTTPINLNNQETSFSDTVGLVYPFEVPRISKLPPTCDVTVEIIPLEEKSSVRIPVKIDGSDDGLDYILSKPDLLISSPAGELEANLLYGVTATLDVSGLPIGEYRMVPQLTLPQSVEQIKTYPPSILVTIIRAED